MAKGNESLHANTEKYRKFSYKCMFTDRKDAAMKLASALSKYRNKNVLVLGIPRGGAETAYYVAQYLNAEMSLVISRKLGYPSNPEAAFGAVAEDGSLYIPPLSRADVTESQIARVLDEQRREIQRRIQHLRGGKSLPDMEGKTVILVDDGIATGATLFAAIELCKNRRVGRLVVAAPISGREMVSKLKGVVDEVVILETPELYFSVSQGYEFFSNLDDDDVVTLMDKWEKEHPVKA